MRSLLGEKGGGLAWAGTFVLTHSQAVLEPRRALLRSGIPVSTIMARWPSRFCAGLIWEGPAGAELWVGGQDAAASGLDGRANLIINCANEDYDYPETIPRFVAKSL